MLVNVEHRLVIIIHDVWEITNTPPASQRAVAYDDMGYSYMSIIYKITYDHILTHICVFLAHIRVPIYRTGI